VKDEVELPVIYKGLSLNAGYRMDLVVEDRPVVELKAVEKVLPVHDAQILTYMKLAKISTGLRINFWTPVIKDGIKHFRL
jgi:GxxExxY protein